VLMAFLFAIIDDLHFQKKLQSLLNCIAVWVPNNKGFEEMAFTIKCKKQIDLSLFRLTTNCSTQPNNFSIFFMSLILSFLA
jgi:hypothetical protein